MTQPDPFNAFKGLLDDKKTLTRLRRGIILEKAILIEGAIDLILSLHFARPEKQFEFMIHILADTLSFRTKINLLEKTQQLPANTIKDLKRLNEIRNVFAHAIKTFSDTVFHFRKQKFENTAQLKKEFNQVYTKTTPILAQKIQELQKRNRPK